MKVASKMFALLSYREGKENLSLKCEPELAEVLRRQYASVTPGYYLNKRHWNTLILDGSIPEREVKEMIDLSYTLVAKSLKREEKQNLANQNA
jgi:predicted DNA-binding protein (MmcQ/YjbR family)